MKTIGLIGGMSWESSLEYYRIINQEVKRRLGGLHSAKCLMYSLDFAEIEQMQHEDRWDNAGQELADAARRLQRGGADLLVLCTNTMHRCASHISAAVPGTPLLHIADATASHIVADGHHNVGLLGTRFTMEQDFYKGRLASHFGLTVLTPPAPQRQQVHDVIYNELCLGNINPASRAQYTGIIRQLQADGAQAVILGCTEIELLISQADSPLPVYPTTTLHALAAVEHALRQE